MSAPQCFAYRFTGERCTDVAGHDDQHSFTIKWGDDECWEPTKVPLPSEVETILEVQKQITAPQEKPKRCFMCEHPWHDEECVLVVDGLECGCTTAVE